MALVLVLSCLALPVDASACSSPGGPSCSCADGVGSRVGPRCAPPPWRTARGDAERTRKEATSSKTWQRGGSARRAETQDDRRVLRTVFQ